MVTGDESGCYENPVFTVFLSQGVKKDYRIIGGFEHCDDVITWAIDDTLCPGFIFIVNIADDTK